MAHHSPERDSHYHRACQCARAHLRGSGELVVGRGSHTVLSALPLLDTVRNLTGLPDSPLTLFLLGAGVFLLMFFRFSVIISHLRDDNVALAQRVAILEYHIQSLKNHEKQEA